jgi:hypothetical protein
MMNDLNPTEKYPALTDERLSLIANALGDVRNSALTLYDPLSGDDQWSHGCQVYARSCFRIRQLAHQHSWLSVIAENARLRFTFAIEGVPIRFYRGSPDDPPPNYLVTTYGELLQRQLFEGLRPLDKILRIAIETDREGRISTAKLVELDEIGEPTGVYLISLKATRSSVTPLEAKSIHLDPPTLEPLHEKEQPTQKKIKKNDRSLAS